MGKIKFLLYDFFVFTEIIIYLLIAVFIGWPLKIIDSIFKTKVFYLFNRMVRYIGNL